MLFVGLAICFWQQINVAKQPKHLQGKLFLVALPKFFCFSLTSNELRNAADSAFQPSKLKAEKCQFLKNDLGYSFSYNFGIPAPDF